MSLNDTKKLAEYTKQFGNKFEAINYMAKEARRLADACDNVILHSQALSWVVSGEAPNSLYTTSTSKSYKYQLDLFIANKVSNILDDSIKRSVKRSLYTSIMAKNLIYKYEENLNQSCKARVRILTRMIWFDIVAKFNIL